MKPPALLSAGHVLTGFDCGNTVMNAWLRERALPNQQTGATRTFVLAGEGAQVVAYYALAVGACDRTEAPGAISRAMPDPIPMVVLARLAVDTRHQGQGIGRQLIADALRRTMRIAREAGVRGLLVSAIDEAAAAYYEQLGFLRSRHAPDVLMLRLKAVEVANPEVGSPVSAS